MGGSAKSDIHFGLQSSLDLSVEASRSTLIFLSLAVHHLASDVFWLFMFYPVSAFLSLFFNLLRSPGNEYAELDLELIGTASEVLRKMPKGDASPEKTAYLDRIFVKRSVAWPSALLLGIGRVEFLHCIMVFHVSLDFHATLLKIEII